MNNIEENIVGQIGGEYIAAAIKGSPSAERVSGDFHESVIEIPHLGKVRFTYRRVRSRHNKSSNVFWSATSAMKID